MIKNFGQKKSRFLAGHSKIDSQSADWVETDDKRGGADRSRTDDPLLAKQVLYQLSYSPTYDFWFEIERFRFYGNLGKLST